MMSKIIVLLEVGRIFTLSFVYFCVGWGIYNLLWFAMPFLDWDPHLSTSSLGKEEEIVTISPRALFVSKKGYTFLAAGKITCIIILMHINILINILHSVIFSSHLLCMAFYFKRLYNSSASINIVIWCMLLSVVSKWVICNACT